MLNNFPVEKFICLWLDSQSLIILTWSFTPFKIWISNQPDHVSWLDCGAEMKWICCKCHNRGWKLLTQMMYVEIKFKCLSALHSLFITGPRWVNHWKQSFILYSKEEVPGTAWSSCCLCCSFRHSISLLIHLCDYFMRYCPALMNPTSTVA